MRYDATWEHGRRKTKPRAHTTRSGRGGSGVYAANMTEQQVHVKGFSYSREVLTELESTLSPQRLSTYVRAVPEHDKEQALRLYIWNIALSSAFYGMLQGLEVTMRNTMHKQLAATYGSAWYDNSLIGLDDGGMKRIRTAKSRLARSGRKRISPAQVVAGLSFGFWVSLLGHGGRIAELNRRANYEMTIWRPALRQAFPTARALTRKRAHAALDELRILRNRIAHHEPIFNRQHKVDYQLILTVTGWISPTTSEWLDHHNRVHMLLDASWRSVDILI